MRNDEQREEPKSAPQEDVSLGTLIDRMYGIRERKRDLAAEEKELTQEYDGLKEELIRRMGEAGADKLSSSLATASIKQEVMPSVKDWDLFYKWIKQEDAFHMLERRPSSGAFRELHAAGEEVPGIEAYTKVDINLRKR